jgi:hypothetical protein
MHLVRFCVAFPIKVTRYFSSHLKRRALAKSSPKHTYNRFIVVNLLFLVLQQKKGSHTSSRVARGKVVMVFIQWCGVMGSWGLCFLWGSVGCLAFKR